MSWATQGPGACGHTNRNTKPAWGTAPNEVFLRVFSAKPKKHEEKEMCVRVGTSTTLLCNESSAEQT